MAFFSGFVLFCFRFYSIFWQNYCFLVGCNFGVCLFAESERKCMLFVSTRCFSCLPWEFNDTSFFSAAAYGVALYEWARECVCVCVCAFERVWRKSNEWLYNLVSRIAHEHRHFGLVSLSTSNTNNRRSIMYQKLNLNFNMCFNDMTSSSVFPIHSIHIYSFSQWMVSSIAFEAGISKRRNNGIQSYKRMPIHWSLRRKFSAHTWLACHWSGEYLRALCHFWGIH